jgi:iron complex transport system permease protein
MSDTQTRKNIYFGSPLDVYKHNFKHKILVLIILFVLLFLMVMVSIFVGSSGISFGEVFLAFFGGGSETARLIVYQIRLPRVVAALVIGASLAIAGLIMQSVLRNPMASPSTLGVSNAAVFGANFAIIVLGGGILNSSQGNPIIISSPYLVTGLAFCFALVAVFLILLLSKIRGFSPEVVVLAGVASGSLFSAGTTIIQYFASSTQLSSAVFWSFGDLSRVSYSQSLIIAVVFAVCFVVFYLFRFSYNALAISDETAVSLGVKVQLVRFISLLLASLLTAVSVSFAGIIGFIGLIAPQLIKRFVGNDIRILLPASALLGALILVISDTLARVIFNGVSLPVGAITSIFGAPIFIYILLRKKDNRV